MQQQLSMMFDDDDGVEPQFKAVDEYYFEHGKKEPVCFSILPLHFDNDEVVNCDSEKKVYLRGVPKKSLYPVHKRVVAWRVELDCEQPKIFVLSSEGNWITILRPRKCYEEKIARSVLITVQILHFIKKHSGDWLWVQLWDHLYEVFDKLDSKPTVDDLRTHLPLVKLFVGRDTALSKSKILRRLIEDTTGEMKEPKTQSIRAQFIVTVESHSSSKDNDDKNDCDYRYNEDDSGDEYSYGESSTEDDCSSSESNSNGDESSDGDSDNDNSTDEICTICDDGGNLLSCIGACKRSFHPRVKDGRESKCRTLGYTSAQLKGISDFLCQNCEYKQHQCFKCGELEPSDELNAKVFKCNNASCGHFYHPKCVAKLLEPDDEACELAKRIMSGMSFTCPVHWCFKCGKMEDKTQRALQFAVCRRCPKSYHRECLPRNISFESKGKHIKQRAWELCDNILIYCRDHRIYRSTGTAGRNHIKFPYVPGDIKTNHPVMTKMKMSGGNRKMAKCLKEDLKFEPSMFGSDASPGRLAVGTQLKNRVMSNADKDTFSGVSHDIASARVHVTHSTLCIYGRTDQDILSANSLVEKDAECIRIAGDKDDGEREKTSACYAGEENGHPNIEFHENHEQNVVLDNLSLSKHAKVEGGELKLGKEGGLERGYNAHEHDSVSEQTGQEKDISMCEQDTGSENGKVPSNGCSNKCSSRSDKVIPDHIDDHPQQKPLNAAHLDKLAIINRMDTDTQPEHGCAEDREVNGSYDCQAEGNSSQSNKNPKTIEIDTACDKLRKRRETKKKITHRNKVELNKNRKYSQRENVNEDPCEGTRHVHAAAHSKNQCHANHKEQYVLDCKSKGTGIMNPRYNGENAEEDISKCKSKKRTMPNRRDKTVCIRAYSSNLPVGRNVRKRLRNYSPGQDMYHRDNYPKNSIRHRDEQKCHVNYSHHDYVSRDLGAGRRRSPPPYLGRHEHGIARRCARRGPEYVPSPRHNSPSRHRTLEDIKRTTDWESFHDLDYDECRYSRSHASPPYSRGPEYGSNRKRTPPFPPRSPDIHQHGRMSGYGRGPDIHPHQGMAEYHTSRTRMYGTSQSPRSEDVGYALDWNSLPRLHYDRYDEYGGYSEMDVDPVARYCSGYDDGAYRTGMDGNMEERMAMYGEHVSNYWERSRVKASGSVTDKYAPRLDQTNHLPIGRISKHYDLPPVRW